jgi:protein gp37
MENSKIEWTDRTYNPIIVKGGGFYCFKVSPACKHCYAENQARRIAAMQGNTEQPYTAREVYPELELKRGMLEGWAKKRDAKRNFVSSMTDIFGEFVPDEWIFEILDAQLAAPRQTFQNLTKRQDRALEIITKWLSLRGLDELPSHIWIGFSVEDQIRAELRLPVLIQIPAKVRFISCEPLLTRLDISHYLRSKKDCPTCEGSGSIPANGKRTFEEGGGGETCPTCLYDNRLNMGPSPIHWVIAGGESGNRRTIRPMHPEAALSLRNQCIASNVPFFFKQWGEWMPLTPPRGLLGLTYWADGSQRINHYEQSESNKYLREKDTLFLRVGKLSAGALLGGKEYKEFPIIT